MPLSPGSRLGPHEIVAPLGAGGMGEVYRAKDTRLGREVAIKVLPQHLSSNPEVRARFEREAKTVSSLNHPNICTLFDVGREGETDYLVMELVEGETLAQRLVKGPLAIAETLKLGAQIADALDRAHRAGVIHRDLKPGNVMLTKSGVKLLDFGLARATGMAGPANASGVTHAALTTSPTVAQPLTAEGTLVGTFQYMAPEQLEGREADARSDLWALGCVLYEMATGKRAFAGGSQASLISSIMKDAPPPLAERAPMTPPALDRLVGALLAKDPEERVQTAHDARLQLRWILEGGTSSSGVSAAPPVPGVRRRGQRELLAWAIAALGLVAAAVALLFARGGEGPVVRAVIPPPSNAVYLFLGDNAGPPVLSPDGSRLAFVAVDDVRGARIWVRDVASLTARPLEGTENASFPFWSWDGRSVAFFAEHKLKRADLATGQVIAICAQTMGRGGSWNQQGDIVFADNYTGGLSKVRAMGGRPEALTTCDSTRHTTHRWPQFLPDGRHFLYFAGDHRDLHGRQNAVWVGSLDGKENRELIPSATEACYGDGQLFYVLDSVLVARPFDAGARRFRGDAVPTAERVQFDLSTWKMNFSVSQAGLLAYQPIGGKQGSQIYLFDRDGRRLSAAGESGNHFDIVFLPGARRIAYSSAPEPNGDLFLYDFERALAQRITDSKDDEGTPVPSPDGRSLAYSAQTASRFRRYAILVRSVDGGGGARMLHEQAHDSWPLDWSSDGRRLLFAVGDVQSYAADSLGVLMLDGSEPPRFFTDPSGRFGYAQFSPDGRWVAYGTSGGGIPQVYLRATPGVASATGAVGAADDGGRVQLSSEGGDIPRWRGDGRELYYARPDGAIVAVELAPGTMQPGRESVLFRAILRPLCAAFDASPDGQRFVINALASAGAAPIVLVSGWKRELEAR